MPSPTASPPKKPSHGTIPSQKKGTPSTRKSETARTSDPANTQERKHAESKGQAMHAAAASTKQCASRGYQQRKREGATVRATSPPAGTIGGNNMHKGQNAPSNAASAGKKTETCCRRGARGSQHSHRPNPTFVRRPFNRRSSTCAQGKGTAPRSHPCTDKATTSSTLARS